MTALLHATQTLTQIYKNYRKIVQQNILVRRTQIHESPEMRRNWRRRRKKEITTCLPFLSY